MYVHALQVSACSVARTPTPSYSPSYVTCALQRGNAKPTGRAVFLTFGTSPHYDKYSIREFGSAGLWHLSLSRLSHSLASQAPSPKPKRAGLSRKSTASTSQTSTPLSSLTPQACFRRRAGARDLVRGPGDATRSSALPACMWRSFNCRSWKPHFIRRIIENFAHAAHGDVVLYRCAATAILCRNLCVPADAAATRAAVTHRTGFARRRNRTSTGRARAGFAPSKWRSDSASILALLGSARHDSAEPFAQAQANLAE